MYEGDDETRDPLLEIWSDRSQEIWGLRLPGVKQQSVSSGYLWSDHPRLSLIPGANQFYTLQIPPTGILSATQNQTFIHLENYSHLKKGQFSKL